MEHFINNNIKWIILLLFAITISGNANQNICIDGTITFETIDNIVDGSFGAFDFPNTTLDQVYDFIDRGGIVHIDHLTDLYPCEKLCSLHVPCTAFKYNVESGCEFWMTELDSTNQTAISDIEITFVKLQAFQDYITGKVAILFSKVEGALVCNNYVIISFLLRKLRE